MISSIGPEDLYALLIFVSALMLEISKFKWHREENLPSIMAHVFSATVMLICAQAPSELVAAAVLVILGSAYLIDLKRAGTFIGQAISALSSWPWHGYAFASLGWFGIPYALIAGWLCGAFWKASRPLRWGPSKWQWIHPFLYPRSLGRWLESRRPLT